MSSARCRRPPAQRGECAAHTTRRATRDAFLTALAKAALPPRVVAALDEPPQAQQAPRFPVSPEGLTLGLTGSSGNSGRRSGVGLGQCNLACLLALVAAAMFLSGALGPGWFEVLEALQNADYVLTTRGAGPLGSTALGPNTGAAFGTPSKAVVR
jgi:protein MON2